MEGLGVWEILGKQRKTMETTFAIMRIILQTFCSYVQAVPKTTNDNRAITSSLHLQSHIWHLCQWVFHAATVHCTPKFQQLRPPHTHTEKTYVQNFRNSIQRTFRRHPCNPLSVWSRMHATCAQVGPFHIPVRSFQTGMKLPWTNLLPTTCST